MKKNKKEKQNYYFAWTCGVVVSIDEGEVFFFFMVRISTLWFDET